MMDEVIKAQLNRIERYALMSAKTIYTLEEAVAYTGFSKHTLYRLTSRCEIPHFKVRGALRFKRSELDEWLTRERVTAQAEMESKAVTYTVLNRR